MADAAIDQDTEPSFLRLKHPKDCQPWRPEASPAWTPWRRDRRDAGQARRPEPVARRSPHLVVARNLGAVRINFRYAAFQSMTAAHSEKAGRDQYFEGPHETYGFRLHEISPTVLDLQYQPSTLAWKTATGRTHSMTFDWAIETESHQVVFGEDKASDAYFEDPDLSERLNFAEAFLESRGARFERRTAGGLPTRLRRRVVKDVYDARRTSFDDASAARVRAVVTAGGGTVRLADVMIVIGHHPARSLDVARAMMHRRILSMPLASPPMPDTPVTIPPRAEKGALRAFLAAQMPVEDQLP